MIKRPVIVKRFNKILRITDSNCKTCEFYTASGCILSPLEIQACIQYIGKGRVFKRTKL